MNWQAFNTFEGVSSDHRIVSFTIWLSLRANKKKQSAFPLYNWFLLTTNSHLKDSDTIADRNKFETIQADAEESSNITYNNFVTSHEKTAADVISLKSKHQQHILGNQIALNHKEKAIIRISNPSLKSIQDFNEVLAQFKNSHEDQQAEYIHEKIFDSSTLLLPTNNLLLLGKLSTKSVAENKQIQVEGQ